MPRFKTSHDPATRRHEHTGHATRGLSFPRRRRRRTSYSESEGGRPREKERERLPPARSWHEFMVNNSSGSERHAIYTGCTYVVRTYLPTHLSTMRPQRCGPRGIARQREKFRRNSSCRPGGIRTHTSP